MNALPAVVAAVLAAGGIRVSPGLLGFLVVAALGLATFFLVRSMMKHVKRVDFDERPQAKRTEEPDGPEEPPTS